MLLAAIKAQKAEGTSLRTLAKRLGYSQATVLSHMSNGRVPIPVERAGDIARALEIDPGKFAKAVIVQRFPDMEGVLNHGVDVSDDLVHTLQLITGSRLDTLTEEQKLVLREVVADPHPSRRWLSVSEIPLVAILRRDVPEFSAGTLDRADIEMVVAILEGK
jgi:DNA-binding transcriptional regulator YdaS (Cro superfamily)